METKIDPIDTTVCPICNRPNNCGQAKDMSVDLCWCAYEKFPAGIFRLVPKDKLNKACICKSCLEKFRQAR